MDRGVFEWINRWPNALNPVMQFFSGATNLLWVKIVLALALIAMLAAGSRSRRTVVQIALSVGIANGITDLLKHNLPFHRPYQQAELGQLSASNLHGAILRVGGDETSLGTASAHSANMAAVAFVLAYQFGWRGTFWIPIALFTGLSRIYVGVHYPWQVLLGWTCGTLSGLAVTQGWRILSERRSRANESVPTST